MVRGRIGLLSVLLPATVLLATTACSGVDVGVVVDDPEASQSDDPGRAETAGEDSSSSDGPSIGADELGVPGCGVDFRSALSESSRLTDAVMVDLDDAEVSLSAPERWRVARHDPVSVAIVDPEPLVDGAAVHWVRVAAPAFGLVFDGPCVPTAGIAPVAEGSPPADCTLTPVEGGIIASWQWEPQAEGRVHVVRDGIVVTTLEAPARGGLDERVAVALDERVAEHTEPGLVDTGLLQIHADPAEPGVVHNYVLAAGSADAPDLDAGTDCGAVEALACGADCAAPVLGDSAGPEPGERSALVAARDQVLVDFVGPFQFVTLRPQCAGCDGETVEMYLVPDLDGGSAYHLPEKLWVDGVERPVSEAGVWGIDPFAVPNLLLDEPEAAWTIDADTQIVTEWEVEGGGASLLCVEVDTRPLDARSERCGSYNLLGSG